MRTNDCHGSSARADDAAALADRPPEAVFVDLDNTLVDGLALFHLGRALARAGVVDRRTLAHLAGHHAWYRLAGERARLVALARRAGLGMATGMDAERVVAAAELAYPDALAPRLRAGTVALVRAYRAAQIPVWVVTASPAELARLVATRLDLSGGLGTEIERHDGVWTGRVTGPVLHGPAKAAAVAQLAAARGWDLRRCAALSDGMADLPLLEQVGHPMAINPDRALRRRATERGWPIRDFRAAARTGVRRHHRHHTPSAAGKGPRTASTA